MSQTQCLSQSSSVGASVCVLVFLSAFSLRAEPTKKSVRLVSWVKLRLCDSATRPRLSLTSALPRNRRAWSKQPNMALVSPKLTEHKSLSVRPPDATLTVTGNRKYLLPPGSQSQTSARYTVCSLAQTPHEARCSMMWVCSFGDEARGLEWPIERRRPDSRVRSLFQAWQLIGSSRKLWYAMANQTWGTRPGSGVRNQKLVGWQLITSL